MASSQLLQLLVLPLCVLLGLCLAVGVTALFDPSKARGFVVAMKAARCRLQGALGGEGAPTKVD
eukprot:CAMPEP_0170575434 /NCGR_PEP_ID=MMETSP0224-20130122/3861_1 /TAXON_ID=285029 /ORGANISM="Togula jolla, Strain CCCM 725" /LENGTH=63 /DNA_ID=CAMNT_0010898217 /DNA_START=54 /DNA_END=245 /DNA_ORIENTATION=+